MALALNENTFKYIQLAKNSRKKECLMLGAVFGILPAFNNVQILRTGAFAVGLMIKF